MEDVWGAIEDMLINADPELLAREHVEGYSALMMAVSHGHLGLVRRLIEMGANINTTGAVNVTALHIAAQGGHEQIVALLLVNGAHNIEDTWGRTPFIGACRAGHLGVVQVLLQQIGAQILDEGDGAEGTALHYASYKGHEDVVSYLLSKGAQASTRDNAGRTPLILASMSGHLGVVRLLAQHLDIQGLEERDDEGHTALYWASCEGRSEIVAFLLSKGAQATSRNNNGATPLLIASGNGDLGVARLFLQLLGPQGLDDRDKDGETALHWAAAEGQVKVVRCLLLAGADPTITSLQGKTPRALAEEEDEELDEEQKERLANCLAVFEWWDGELERRAILARATCLHRADTMRRDMPTSQVPTYLEARVAAGHAVPRVEVVLPQSREQQQEGKQTGANSKRKAAGEGDGAQGAEEVEEEEMHAMLRYVVSALNEELVTELLEGFHSET